MNNNKLEIINKRTEVRLSTAKAAEEGGCGVIGFMASVPVRGQHIIEPSIQMHNRGNGKGGGIAAVGLSAKDLGVTQDVLDSHYLLQVALLDPAARDEIEHGSIEPYFDIATAAGVPSVDDYREVPGLELKPPDVRRYFVRVKEDVLAKYMAESRCADPRAAEDEFVFRNSFALNQRLYTSLGEKRAFVLSHGRNLMILKIVGYAEQAAQYYRLEDFHAHGWIAHQRYPTKGRVWHPGGAHPFIGLNEALVHNGDFANYTAITDYLKQFGRQPQFLTDTEVAVLLFDLWNRRFGYPLEYITEALAPTSEYDFDLLPPEKQGIYKAIQAAHMASSPDGPWFFIIARNNTQQQAYELIGITDTSMLRPQVFALSDGEVQIGLVASEKQAIDATLASLAQDDPRFCPVADKYWNARGGSATDGGSFIFRVKESSLEPGTKTLTCVNKFGEAVTIAPGREPADANLAPRMDKEKLSRMIESLLVLDRQALESLLISGMAYWDYATVKFICRKLAETGTTSDKNCEAAAHVLTLLNDRRYDTGVNKRAVVLDIIRSNLKLLFDRVPTIKYKIDSRYARLEWATRDCLRAPEGNETVLVINARDFPPEGEECDARIIVSAHKLGWRNFIGYGYRGQRFTGCGLGPGTQGVRIDVYDSPGDYLASGIDGLEIHVHASAQDQLGQIMKSGKLVIHGDVGQTFMYGSKGGEVYVLGSTAGRPLINAVGRPRVVINGTSLDYLAESFMAGNPLQDGGFVIVNGITLDEKGQIKELPTPYPGSNLFSLASGGAIYIRDPDCKLVDEQLNGGQYTSLADEDWRLILPYLQENERLFGIPVAELLRVDGRERHFSEVYRKVQPMRLAVLASANATAGN